jgi:hypothetical protein
MPSDRAESQLLGYLWLFKINHDTRRCPWSKFRLWMIASAMIRALAISCIRGILRRSHYKLNLSFVCVWWKFDCRRIHIKDEDRLDLQSQ